MYDDEYIEEAEENVYNESAREESLDNDEISAEEEAFMKGYDEASDEKKEPENEDEEDDLEL